MQLKDYQIEALEKFEAWLKSLEEAWDEAEKAKQALHHTGIALPRELTNFPKMAWEKLRGNGRLPLSSANAAYVDRSIGESDDGEPLPHICLKVPTGGGKTLIAAATVERYFRPRGNPSGLLLWIVPTRAIYEQTKATLWNREHPYRQMLERACNGRVKVLEKDEEFTAQDVEHYLCVMLLMLPAANRQKGKDFLRMFRNTGRYGGFFPEEGDLLAEGEFQHRNPTLEREAQFNIVKHSLFNVFKICRPIVILDEAHKAYGKKLEQSQEYARAISRMDPRVVVELSATPNHRLSNVLVDISGEQLRDEEMIKLPIEVTTREGVDDWQATLDRAQSKLEELSIASKQLEASEGRYVRPIAVVRVKFTGKNQRDGFNVHAEDAREHLINLGVQPDAIRVKSAEKDELGREDLLNDINRSEVRWIITKDALKEGWDCSFAYVLVLLDNTQAKTTLTQMVGRVLRMPQARDTGIEALDRCYVVCHNVDVGNAIQNVRAGLENEGLGDLSGRIIAEGTSDLERRAVERRAEFRGRRIFLPKVLHKDEFDNVEWRDLDYDRDILACIDWEKVEIGDLQSAFGETATEHTSYVDLDDSNINQVSREIPIDRSIELAYFARRLAPEVPNPWRAAQLARVAVDHLVNCGETKGSVFDQRARLAQRLRENVRQSIDCIAETVFKSKLEDGEIRFQLTADDGNYEVPQRLEVLASENDAPFTRGYGVAIQKSLFEIAYDHEFDSDLERRFARYLDEHSAIQWWHRVAVRQRGSYYLRGWRQHRVFPDFIVIAETLDDAKQQILVYETKGAHLLVADDGQYKQELLALLERTLNEPDLASLNDGENTLRDAGDDRGTMELHSGNAVGKFRIVLDGDFHQVVDGALAGTIAKDWSPD